MLRSVFYWQYGKEHLYQMENFTFYSPTYFAFGDGQEKQTGELVRRFGGSRVLLHYGGGSIKHNGVYAAVCESLRETGLYFAELGGVKPNPRSGLVYEGIELCRKEKLDFVLAVGGGSTIDSAKAIALGTPYDGDFWDFFSDKAKPGSCLPIGTVLTIPAAGSEGSPNVVITHESGNLKWGLPKNDLARPKFSVLNPRFTCTLPAYQTACGVTDMMAHICERYFTNTADVEITDRLCEAVLKTVIEAAPRAIENPHDYAARANIMWAGMLAHNNSLGVGREQDWSSHQIEHELSALNDCTHGAGLAVVMPAWMEYVMGHNVSRFAQFAVRVWDCDMNFAHPEITARQGIERFRAFLRSIGMPEKLSDLNIGKESFSEMVAHRRLKGFPFGCFVRINEQEMTAILNIAAR